MAKGRVKFDDERCKGCGLCITACPFKIVQLNKSKMNSKGYYLVHITEPDKCTGCANCATMCPDAVITVERE